MRSARAVAGWSSSSPAGEPGRAGGSAPPALVGRYEREAAVSGFVLRGLSTDDIARVLCISPLTVQQHVKAIFDKTGVRSRRELVAQTLTDDASGVSQF